MGEESYAKESAVCRNIQGKPATSMHLLVQVCASNSLTMLTLAFSGISCKGNFRIQNSKAPSVRESGLDGVEGSDKPPGVSRYHGI